MLLTQLQQDTKGNIMDSFLLKTKPLWKQETTQNWSDFCNEEEIKQYQTLIGQLQWLISLWKI